jgi:hypothetical protein
MNNGLHRPGDQVPSTGVYTAAHYQHRLPHDLLAMAGDLFPECRRCGKRVSFTLSQSAIHIDEDHDFSKNAEPADVKRKSAGDR